MSTNSPELKAGNSLFVLIVDPMRVASVQNFELTIYNCVRSPWVPAGNLGFIFDDILSFKHLCPYSAADAPLHLQTLVKIRDYLPRDLTSGF